MHKKKPRRAPRNSFEQKGWDFLKKHKVSFEYEPERLPYVVHANYIPDFVLKNNLYIEFKGRLKPEDRRKMKCIKEQYPDKDIRIVFYNKNSSYIRWADKLGYKWSIGQIPEEWIKE